MLPYFQELVTIRQAAIATLKGFPSHYCSHLSRAVFEVTGLLEVAGQFFIGAHHAWNYDTERNIYVDLTMGQFGDYPDIAVLPVTTPLLKECPTATSNQRYNKDRDFAGIELFRERYSSLIRRN